jgi:uncharacterized membrane protein YjgN (DUF898 family)
VRYLAQNHAYGETPFVVEDFRKPFIRAYVVALGLGLVGAGALLLAASRFAAIGAGELLPVAIYAGFLLLYALVRAHTTNAVWNAIRVGPLRFECTLRARDYMWIYLTNVVAILATLGFATPWAVIRTLRYRAAKFAAFASAPIDAITQAEGAHVGAAGQEIAELFDFDIAL